MLKSLLDTMEYELRRSSHALHVRKRKKKNAVVAEQFCGYFRAYLKKWGICLSHILHNRSTFHLSAIDFS